MAGQGYHGDDRRDWDRDHHGEYRDYRDHRDYRGHEHDYRPAPPPRIVYRPAPPPRVVYRPAPPRWGVYSPPRGYYAHSWRRGERLPVAYYAPRYVIGNYHECGLRVPPRGYHWVRVNNDAVLAAVATGVVLDVALNLFS
jgi:Ni/Co efflux regulator RcnB